MERYTVSELVSFAHSLFLSAGCDDEKAKIIAEILIEADLMGHTTHGLALASNYLAEIEKGTMLTHGDPKVLVDRGAIIIWDGNYLPGVWLTASAVDLACERARLYGLCVITLRRSHHIACLSAYLQRATSHELMVIIASSDPAAASVAPYGGKKPVFTPDPLAVGIPTEGDPIWIDMSASITTNGLSARLNREGKRFPAQWVMDANGSITDDPSVIFADPPGSILPSGGADHGHKGYGWALLIEALTQGLGGYGRAERPSQWGASVFIQVMDPELFAGLDAFRREMQWTAEACRDNPPIRADAKVRLPGEASMNRRRSGLRHGVQLYPGVLESLTPWAEKFGIDMPAPIE